MANKEQVQVWLDSISIVTTPTNDEFRALEELLDSDGFAVFLGLMMGGRQGEMVKLSNLPLSSPERVTMASVIQGKILGVDMIWQTLLDLFTPAGEQTTDEEQN